MIGPALFTIAMVVMLTWCLLWLLMGDAHASAHPQGERPHFWVDLFYKPGRFHHFPQGYPNIVLWAGPSYRAEEWGLHLLWHRSPRSDDDAGVIPYLRQRAICFRRVMRPSYRLVLH